MNVQAWENIGCNTVVLDWIKNGVKIPFVSSPPDFQLRNHRLTFTQTAFIKQELERLLSLRYIVKLDTKPKYISPIGCVPKKTKGFRLIVDFRHLNSYCSSSSFKQEDIKHVAEIIEPKDKLSSIDIKDGFYHIPVDKSYQEYLSFEFNNNFYSFTVCPFGLCLSPYFFSKTLRPVVTYLRSLGVRLSLYVDDFLICAAAFLATDHTDLVINCLEDLGFKINFDKSCLLPSHNIDYLGYEISTTGAFPVIKAKKERTQRIKRQIKSVLRHTTVKARVLAKTAGLCVSVAWAVSPGKLFLRHLYRLLSTKYSWDDYLLLDEHCVNELEWWLNAIDNWNYREVKNVPVDGQLITDASRTGWGGTLGNLEASGQWDAFIANQSSNYRELYAIYMCIESFKKQLCNKRIQILTDNISAMAYINHKGGPCPTLSDLVIQVWALAEQIGLSIDCRHISGINNVSADRLSRIVDKSNWMLNPGIFFMLDAIWGQHTIDRFASNQNSHLKRFNSRFWEPGSEGIDALAQDWHCENNFINPPWTLLPKVVEKIIQEKAWATVVAPVWPSQHWFQKLQTIVADTPIFLPRDKQTFIYMGALPEPERNKHWKIAVWRVFGGLV